MNLRTKKIIIGLSVGLILLTGHLRARRPTIALQPLGAVNTDLLAIIATGIKSLFNVNTIILKPVNLPAVAYYPPRKRYRAYKLLLYLQGLQNNLSDLVVGITSRDISATKGRYYDWGIFGYAFLGGKVCVASTYRLKRGKPGKKLFHHRIISVVNHEIGHLFNLEHCPTRGCLMEDARGTIKTVDNSAGKLCEKCRAKIRKHLKLIKFL